ncbi:MAG TPA: GUN4 domain-containing protein [Trichocoleus sp.]
MPFPSEAQYREVVQHYVRAGAISPRVRQLLERQRQWLKLLPHEAQAIEQSVLQTLQTADLTPAANPFPPLPEQTFEPFLEDLSLSDSHAASHAEPIAPQLDLSNLSLAPGSSDPILIPVSASLRLRISVAIEPADINIAHSANDISSASTSASTSDEHHTDEQPLAIEAAKPLALLEGSQPPLVLEEQKKSEDLDLENFDLRDLGLENSDLANLLSLVSENPSIEELRSVISQLTAPEQAPSLRLPIEEDSPEYRQNKELYQAEFKSLLYQRYPQPISEADHSELKRLQHNLQIVDEDVSAIEAQVLAEHQQTLPQEPFLPESRSLPESTHHQETPAESVKEHTVELPSQKESEQDYFATPIEAVINPEAAQHQATEEQPSDAEPQPPVTVASHPEAPSFISDGLAQLDDKLYNQQWREADRLTLTLMLQLAKQERWLDEQTIKRISDKAAVQAIDRLWRQYSQNYLKQEFGFQAQCALYRSMKPAKLDGKIARDVKLQQAIDFVNQVGWWTPRLNCFRFYEQLDFPTSNLSGTVRPGHLPALWFWTIPSLESFRLGGIGTGLGGCRLMVDRLDGMLAHLERLLQ